MLKKLSTAGLDVLAERQRQVREEGWTAAHDDAHTDGQMAAAAGCYALHACMEAQGKAKSDGFMPGPWPWDAKWWKPKGARRDLIRAAALIVAEIERLDRIEAAKGA